jgi:hypothetical protein
VPSHYNFTTTFDAILMRGGAAGTAGVFLVGMVVLLVSSLRTRASDETPASLLLGVRLGVVVMLIGCVIGFVMISNMSGIWNGQFGSAFGEPQSGYLGPDTSPGRPRVRAAPPCTPMGRPRPPPCDRHPRSSPS